MCYHKQLRANIQQIEKYYDANARDLEYSPTYYENGFDFKEDPVLTVERPKEILLYRWGFTPWFEKDLAKVKAPVTTLNCISEEMFEKPSFRDAAKAGKRCLIPATGFFEWHWDHPTKAKNKTPYIIKAKDQEIFSIAGLYSYWKDKATDTEILSYTVLTTSANPQMAWLHNSKKRQPVIIRKEYEKDWLNPNLTEQDVLELCKSMPEDFLTYYSIGKQISGNKLTSEEKNTPDIEKRVDYSPEEIDAVPEAQKESKTTKPKKSKGDQSQGSLF